MVDKPDIEIILPGDESRAGGSQSSHRQRTAWRQDTSAPFSGNAFGNQNGHIWTYGLDGLLNKDKKKRGPLAAVGNVVATIFGAFALITIGTIASLFMVFAILLGGLGRSKPGFQVKRFK